MSAEKQVTGIRKEQIVTAALNLLASQGMKALTVDRLARMVGLVPSALYRHFRNKGEIMDAILLHLRERLLENIAQANLEAPQPLAVIHRLLLRHVHMLMEFQALPRLLFSDEINLGDPGLRARLHGVIQDFLAALAEVFSEGQRQGQIRADIPAYRLAVMFIGLFQPSVALWHLSGGTFDLVSQVDASWRVWSAAIQGEAAGRSESGSQPVESTETQ